MKQDEVLNIYRENNALLSGHFLLSSGRHSDQYLQSALVLQDPKLAEKLGRALADKFRDVQVDVVVGPAMGGITVAYEAARALGVRALFTERENGEMTLRRGFEIKKGEKVLICEDVVTTGKSVREVIKYLEGIEADIAGVGYLIDRSNGRTDFGYPSQSLLALEVLSYEASDCPLCGKGLPLVKPGSRK